MSIGRGNNFGLNQRSPRNQGFFYFKKNRVRVQVRQDELMRGIIEFRAKFLEISKKILGERSDRELRNEKRRTFPRKNRRPVKF